MDDGPRFDPYASDDVEVIDHGGPKRRIKVQLFANKASTAAASAEPAASSVDDSEITREDLDWDQEEVARRRHMQRRAH